VQGQSAQKNILAKAKKIVRKYGRQKSIRARVQSPNPSPLKYLMVHPLLSKICVVLQRVTVTLKRGGDKGLGFSIAGGRGSTAYKDGDPVSKG